MFLSRMSRSRTFRSLSLAVCLLLNTVAVTAQDDAGQANGDVAKRIQRIVDRYGSGELDRAWAGCRALEEFEEELVGWAETALTDGTVIHQLMAAKSLIAIGEVDKPEPIERALRKIAQASDNTLETRIAAVEMLGEFGAVSTIKALERLLEEDAKFDASLRIAAATALFRCANDYRKTRDSLMPLLDVDDATVRAKAAIALGEMGYVDGKARRLLTSLEKEPTALGAQARMVLQQDLLMRRLERMRDRQSGGIAKKTEAREVAKLERELELTSKQLGTAQAEIAEMRRTAGSDPIHPLIGDLIKRIRRLYVDPKRVDQRALIVAAAKGMVASLDPFSSFMDVTDVEQFNEGISGEYAGIGAQVAKDAETDHLKILRPIYKGPAYEAGLLTDDKIIEVEGFFTKGVPLSEIVKRLKGDPGTPVQLKVYRRGWNDTRPFSVERRTIRLDSVRSTMLPGSIGYVSLSQFGDTAVSEIIGALDKLEAQEMKGLILDLRNNPGGYLDAATSIVDQFVGEKDDPIVTQKDLTGNFQALTTRSTPGQRGDYPIVVLINGSSASASEIVSGALQDFGRATLVGKKSFGKGSVQRLLTLPVTTNDLLGGETQLRLTIQYYYLPSGRSIHTQRDAEGRVTEEGGVTPDIEQDPIEVPLWRVASLEKLFEQSAFERYLEKYYLENKKAFDHIAEHGDGDRDDAYPGFHEFFDPINVSRADAVDIRRTLRNKLRRIAQDQRGAEFACDYPADVQLQRAISVMLEKLGADGAAIDEYKVFLASLGPAPEKSKSEPPK